MIEFSFFILSVTLYPSARQPLKCTQQDEDATYTSSSCQIPYDTKICFYEIRFDTFKASKSSLKLCCILQKSAKTVSHNHSCHIYCSFLVLCWTNRLCLHSPFIILCFSSRSFEFLSQKGSLSKKCLYKTLISSIRLQVCLSICGEKYRIPQVSFVVPAGSE